LIGLGRAPRRAGDEVLRMPKVPMLSADSRDVPVAARLDWWRGAVGEVFDICSGSPDAAADSGATASDGPHRLSGVWWRYDRVLLGTVVFDANRATRLERHVRSDQLDHYRLILKTAGSMHCETDRGERLSVRPGELLLHDLSRPVAFDFEAGSNILLVVPREMLDEALPLAVDLHGVRLQGTTASLLAAHLQELVRLSPQVEVEQAPMLTQATVSLLAASIAPSVHALARPSKAVETTLLRQMCRYVDLHLAEPNLSAESMAQFFSVSRSRLYRLFEPLGGVANFVRERRLARMHALLEQPSRQLTVGRLAEDHGFKSAAHFSRAFREQYGYSPNDLRLGRTNVLARRAQGGAGAQGPSVHAWIRSLRD
jgi:AraC-like DNA-binding protein